MPIHGQHMGKVLGAGAAAHHHDGRDIAAPLVQSDPSPGSWFPPPLSRIGSPDRDPEFLERPWELGCVQLDFMPGLSRCDPYDRPRPIEERLLDAPPEDRDGWR